MGWFVEVETELIWTHSVGINTQYIFSILVYVGATSGSCFIKLASARASVCTGTVMPENLFASSATLQLQL